jgi:shikimate dehydrogenase
MFFLLSMGEEIQSANEFCQVEVYLETVEPEKSRLEMFISRLMKWYENNMNYGTIMFLMALENSFLPAIPSEIIISPAAFVASKPDSDLNIFLVIVFASLGSLIGALIIYGISLWIGRRALYKFADSRLGHVLMFDSDKIRKAEEMFKKRSKASVFFGRFVAGVRLAISIPAGLSKMNLFNFVLFTFLGTAVYNTMMALIGYFLQGQSELIKKHSYGLSVAMVVIAGLAVLFFILRYFMHRFKDEKKYGLIGFPLTHSFSKRYFTEKFKREKINAKYFLFEIEKIDEVEKIIQKEKVKGLNVTIPYKEQIIPFVDELDETAKEVGAVNVLKITHEGKSTYLYGYNTDVIGFEKSIKPHLKPHHTKALILGSGGASKAIEYVLCKLGIEITRVSRAEKAGFITYESLDKEIINKNTIIINATPLGTFPDVETCPDIPYQYITDKHLLFDVVYNPDETLFLKKGKAQGADTINGEKMLVEQAEAAWRIWMSEP